MNIRAFWAVLFALVVLWSSTSAESGVKFLKSQFPTTGSSPLAGATGALAASSALIQTIAWERNSGMIAATLETGGGALSTFSGTANDSPSNTAALYAGATITLPNPGASLASQIDYFDIVLLDLNTGEAFSILPLFTNLTIVSDGHTHNPTVTAVLSTGPWGENLLAEAAAAAGGKFQISTVITDKSGVTSMDRYYLLSDWSAPEGIALFEQRVLVNEAMGEPENASLNYVAGPPIVFGFPPEQGKRLILRVGDLTGPDEDGSYLGTVQSSDCISQTAQRCASQFYPPGTNIRIYPF